MARQAIAHQRSDATMLRRSAPMTALASTRPLPYRARASVGEVLIADSERPIRVDVPDAAPELWFPRVDVIDRVLGTADGAWRTGAGSLAGHVAFDHDRVQLELVDAVDGDDPRDVTMKRFPVVGRCRRPHRHHRRATRRRRPLPQHRAVLRPSAPGRRGQPDPRPVDRRRVTPRARTPGGVGVDGVHPRLPTRGTPYQIALEPVTGGRTFTALRAEATQAGRTCAFGTLLLDVTAPDLIRHADAAPRASRDRTSRPRSTCRSPAATSASSTTPTRAIPTRRSVPPELSAWVRFRDVPDDPPVHAGLLAQFTGHLSIAAALRPHAGIGQDQAHRTHLHRHQRHLAVDPPRRPRRPVDALPPPLDLRAATA